MATYRFTDQRIDDLIRGYRDGRLSRRQLVQALGALGLAGTMLGGVARHAAGAPATGGVRRPARYQETPTAGGTVVIGCYQEANSLNWILTGSPIAFSTMQLYPMFDPLLRVNLEGALEPVLLTEIPSQENGGISADGLTYTLKFRPGVAWEDGQPCTAKDFVFTWRWIMDPKNSAVNTSGWSQIADIQTPDDLTAVITLKGTYVPFLNEVLVFWPLLPEHIQSTMTTEEYGRKPVGNGPFKFVEWVPGDHITLARNDNYWREQKAYLDQIIFKIVPDRNTVIAQAKTGDIDLGIDYTEAQIPEMEQVPGVTLLISPSAVYERYHFTMILNDGTTPHPIFQDIAVRQAITAAIDRQTIIDTVLFGKTEIAKNELDNTSWENTAIVPDPFDPESAMAMLDQAGWAPGDGGTREKEGTKLAFVHATTAGNQTRETIQALVQQNLKDVGVEMSIQNEPASTFFGSYAEDGGYLARKIDMTGFTDGLPTADPNLRLMWHSAEIPTPEDPSGINFSGLSVPELDALLDQQLSEVDQEKRKALLDQAQVLIHDNYPMVPMYDRVVINSVSDRVGGVNPVTYGSISGMVWNTNEWHVKP